MTTIISWNVNGIRATLKHGFADFMQKTKPDILCLQEIKAERTQVDLELAGYEQIWNSAQKKGYAGTAIFSRIKALSTTFGLGQEIDDTEGRVITIALEQYFLVNVYTPNSKRDLSRLKYRMQWDQSFLRYLKLLEKQKPVIFCGDLNVAHTEIDLANPKANVGNHGFTPEERAGFSNFMNAGFVDAFREFQLDGNHYTWWSPMHNARNRNIGWRIDYFCISQALRPNLKEAFILSDILGSDHCPVGIIIL